MGSEAKFHEKITVVEMRAFDRPMQEHFFDKEPEQITDYIFKNICDTAVIKNITEYTISGVKHINDFKTKK
jgi:hypothetical protein